MREDYNYDFKVDVPILNGIIHYPMYMERGLKIIPLTETAIEEELQSASFVKAAPELREKPNLFSVNPSNIHRKQDKQKYYPANQGNVTHTFGLGDELSRWLVHRERSEQK